MNNDAPKTTSQPDSIAERMRADWNERAREDPHFYVAFGSHHQDEENFLATGREVVGTIEFELRRFPPEVDRSTLRALEIGCGPGRLMKPLSRNFAEIHGVDVSDEMIRLARERLRGIPHAHVHVVSNPGLAEFGDRSFDLIYSYAVYQHIPSREVVLEYMRATRRLLTPGGIFRGQFNSLPQGGDPNTWIGVTFSADEIRAFTRANGLQLLALESAGTQYMWTTWRKPALARTLPPTTIRRITSAHRSEPAVPNSGRHAAIAVWTVNLPEEADLNSLDVRIDGASGVISYIGAPDSARLQQVNVALPQGVRTGLVPVELALNGVSLCKPAVLRVMPAGPLTPRVMTVTDGINLVEEYRSTTGSLKVHIEELLRPESIRATIAGRQVRDLTFLLVDPLPPRYSVDFFVPEGLGPGRYPLQLFVGQRALVPVEIEVAGKRD